MLEQLSSADAKELLALDPCFERDDLTWVVYCRPKIAAADIYGHGSNPIEAFLDLVKSYKELKDFASDSDSKWWRDTYR